MVVRVLPTERLHADTVGKPLPESRDEQPPVICRAEVVAFALVALLVISIVAVLYFAKPFFLPVVLAFVVGTMLSPAANLLERYRIPRSVGALLIVTAVTATIAFMIGLISSPLMDWSAHLPELGARLKDKMHVFDRPLALWQELQMIDLDNPMKPEVVTTIPLKGAGHTALQFRYLFAMRCEGLKVIDITDVRRRRSRLAAHRRCARCLCRPHLRLRRGRRQGTGDHRCRAARAPWCRAISTLVIDACAVRIGMTNASLFAYVADGRNGLRVLQMMAPDRTDGLWGFSPEPSRS